MFDNAVKYTIRPISSYFRPSSSSHPSSFVSRLVLASLSTSSSPYSRVAPPTCQAAYRPTSLHRADHTNNLNMTVSAIPSPEELPHLWQRPAYTTLLDVLQRLRQEPRIWGLKESREEILKAQAASMAEAAFNRQEIISFLSSIIKSGLPWLDNDEQREDIWEEASRRLAERCGRTGMCKEFVEESGTWEGIGQGPSIWVISPRRMGLRGRPKRLQR